MRFMLGLIFVVLSTASFAQDRSVPDRFAACGNFKVPDESAGVFFSSDCKTAFVMPARTGTLRTTSVLPSPHIRACRIRDAQVRAAERRLEEISSSDVDQTSADTRQCGLITPRVSRLESRISRIELSLSAQSDRIVRLQDRQEACLEDSRICSGVVSDLEAAFSRKLSLEHQLVSSESKLRSLTKQYPSCFSEPHETLLEAGLEQDELLEISEIAEALFSEQSSFLDGLEGDTVNVLISLEHSGIVDQARKDNPDFVVRPAPIELALSVNVAEDTSLGRNAVESSTVPLVQSPKSFFDSEENLDPAGVSTRIFGPTASGQLILSIDGTCASRREGLDHRFLAGYLSANIIYRMPVKFAVKVEATASFEELFSRIAKQTTKGGFFRTSSSSSVVNSLRSDEVVKVTIMDDGVLTADQRLELTNSVKDRIVQRGIDLVAKEYLPNANFVSVAAPNENGADVAAKGIRETCKAKWCQVAAVVLDVSSAIFGGTSSIQSFVRERDIKVSEIITLETVYNSYGSIGLVVE